jgi:chromosomal replication initiator protein
MQGTITGDNLGPVVQEAAKAQQARTAGAQVVAITEALAQKIGQQKYGIWFKNSTRFTLADNCLRVGVTNLFMANWLENHFLTDIALTAQLVLGSSPRIIFGVDGELAGDSPRTQVGRLNCSIPALQAQSAIGIESRLQNTYAGTLNRHETKLKFTLDNFVVGPTNELAFNAARAVIKERQSPFNPLFIHGGCGVGKTHLLQGVCTEVFRSRPDTNWLYLSAEDFANQFVLALKTKKLEAFRRRMRQTDLLVIDDVHFLASKPSTQEEFLHTFNTVSLAGKQVVLASDAHPKTIAQLSEKLVNRFVSGMVVKVEPPDFQMRCEICRRYSKTVIRRTCQTAGGSLQIGRSPNRIPEEVIGYIADKLRTNVRELEGAMLKLIACSSLQHRAITLSMAQEVLAEHVERCDPIVHTCDIEDAVATYFGTTSANIRSARKDRTVTIARHFCMYLVRKHSKMSSSEVGRLLGNKNHATVLMGCRKIAQMIEQNADVHWRSPDGHRITKAKEMLSHLEDSIRSPAPE